MLESARTRRCLVALLGSCALSCAAQPARQEPPSELPEQVRLEPAEDPTFVRLQALADSAPVEEGPSVLYCATGNGPTPQAARESAAQNALNDASQNRSTEIQSFYSSRTRRREAGGQASEESEDLFQLEVESHAIFTRRVVESACSIHVRDGLHTAAARIEVPSEQVHPNRVVDRLVEEEKAQELLAWCERMRRMNDQRAEIMGLSSIAEARASSEQVRSAAYRLIDLEQMEAAMRIVCAPPAATLEERQTVLERCVSVAKASGNQALEFRLLNTWSSLRPDWAEAQLADLRAREETREKLLRDLIGCVDQFTPRGPGRGFSLRVYQDRLKHFTEQKLLIEWPPEFHFATIVVDPYEVATPAGDLRGEGNGEGSARPAWDNVGNEHYLPGESHTIVLFAKRGIELPLLGERGVPRSVKLDDLGGNDERARLERGRLRSFIEEVSAGLKNGRWKGLEASWRQE